MNRFKSLFLICLTLSSAACQHDAELSANNETLAQELMINKGCSSCHSLAKLAAAKGMVGPPLDNMSEQSYIAGVLPNSRDNLVRFLLNPQQFHANTAMPKPDLTRQQAQLVTDYLWND